MKYITITFFLLLFTSSALSQEDTKDSPERDTTFSATDSFVNKETIKDTVHYEADLIEYDLKTRTTLLTGKGVVKYKDLTLFADTIHLLFDERMLTATGEPTLIEGTDTVVGFSMTYNLKDRRGRVNYAAAYTPESHYTGNEINKSDDEVFYITHGDYSSCEVIDSQHYSFYSRNIKVIPNDKAISRPMILNIAKMPILALPYFIVPLEQGRQSGWLNPKWGGNPANGAYLDNVGYYWAPNDFTDFLLAGKIDNFRNYLARGRFRYAKRYKFSGSLGGEITNSIDPDGYSNQWKINYNHRQELLPDKSFQLTGTGNILSQSDYFYETSYDPDELISQKVNANMNLTKSLKKLKGSTSLKWNMDHNLVNDNRIQEAPSFNFNLNPRPLISYESSTSDKDLKWFNKINYNYKINAKNKIYSTKESSSTHNVAHAGINHSTNINMGLKIFKWIDISPYIDLTHSVFDSYISDSTWITRKLDTLTEEITIKTFNLLSEDSISNLIILDSIYDKVPDPDTVTHIVVYKDTVSIDIENRDTTYFNSENYEFNKANAYNLTGGISISTKLFGIFPVNIGRFKGFRHVFTPRVTYGASPKSKTADYSRHFPGIGISSSESDKAYQNFNFNFSNLFQTKFKKKNDKGELKDTSITLLNPSISTSYVFEKSEDAGKWHRSWGNISLGTSNSLRFGSIGFNSTFTPYDIDGNLIFPRILKYSFDIRPKSLKVSGKLWSGNHLSFNDMAPENYLKGIKQDKKPGWNFNLTPNFNYSWSRPTLEDNPLIKRTFNLNSNAKIQFTHRWSVSWSSRYSFERNKFENHSLNFYCDLECWDLKFNWSPLGVNEGSFNFLVKIKKYPEIKWDRNDRH